MLKKAQRNVWHLWDTVGHGSGLIFCQTANTSNFKLECLQMVVRKFC